MIDEYPDKRNLSISSKPHVLKHILVLISLFLPELALSEEVYWRLGLGYSNKNGTMVLDKPLLNEQNESVSIIKSLPQSCFMAPGVTAIGPQHGDPILVENRDFTWYTNAIYFLGKINTTPFKLYCGKDSVIVNPLLEASRDRKSWFIWDNPPDDLINKWFNAWIEEVLIDKDNKDRSVKYNKGGSTRLYIGANMHFATLVKNGVIHLAIDNSSEQEREELIRSLRKSGLTVESNDSKDGLFLTVIKFEKFNPHENFVQIKRAVSFINELSIQTNESYLTREYGEDYINNMFDKYMK